MLQEKDIMRFVEFDDSLGYELQKAWAKIEYPKKSGYMGKWKKEGQ